VWLILANMVRTMSKNERKIKMDRTQNTSLNNKSTIIRVYCISFLTRNFIAWMNVFSPDGKNVLMLLWMIEKYINFLKSMHLFCIEFLHRIFFASISTENWCKNALNFTRTILDRKFFSKRIHWIFQSKILLINQSKMALNFADMCSMQNSRQKKMHWCKIQGKKMHRQNALIEFSMFNAKN